MIQIQLQKALLSSRGPMNLSVGFEIQPGEILSIRGPSGSGKTTILRLIAGLIHPEKGYIEVAGSTWLNTEQQQFLPPQRRDIGFVFQDYALFPNMTVRENLEFALKKNQPPQIIQELIDLMDLSGLAKRRPQQLSGGQQQRVALARALVRQPRLLLLDEPLSALDTHMRLRLQSDILALHRTYGLTTILVSHDTHEILRLADRVINLKEGRIEQTGTPLTLFSQTQQKEIFQLKGQVINLREEGNQWEVLLQIGSNEIWLSIPEGTAQQLAIGDSVLFCPSASHTTVIKSSS